MAEYLVNQFMRNGDTYKVGGGGASRFSGLKAGENLSKGDAVQIGNKMYDVSLATSSNAFGGSGNTKGAISFIGDGNTIQDLQIKANVISGAEPTSITVNLEGDNNGAPDGTSLSTVDIVSNLKSNTSMTASGTLVTTGGVATSGALGGFYIDEGNYLILNPGNNSFTSTSNSIDIGIKNNSFGISGTWSIPISSLCNATGLTLTNRNYIGLIVSSDWKYFYIIYRGLNESGWTRIKHDYKFINNNGPFGGTSDLISKLEFVEELSSFNNTTSTGQGTGYTTLVFTEDGLGAYTADDFQGYSNGGSGNCRIFYYTMTTPFDLATATQPYSGYIKIFNGLQGLTYYAHPSGTKYLLTSGRGWSAENITSWPINNDGTLGDGNQLYYYYNNYSHSAPTFFAVGPNAGGNGIRLNVIYSSTGGYLLPAEEWLTSPIKINFSLGTAYNTVDGQKYWLTFTPTGESVQDSFELSSYSGDEWTGLSYYGSSWSDIDNRSPYINGNGIKSLYIVKQYEDGIPFGNYGIADKDYNAFSNASFINMGPSNNNTGLSAGQKYYMNGGNLSTSGGQYIGTAVSDTILDVGYLVPKNQQPSLGNIVYKYTNSTAGQYTGVSKIGSFTTQVDGYYLPFIHGYNYSSDYPGGIDLKVDGTVINSIRNVSNQTTGRIVYGDKVFIPAGTTVDLYSYAYNSSYYTYIWNITVFGPELSN